MNEKIKIGLIAYWFPPEKGVAVLRLNAFAKYLDKEKYDLTVFTVNQKNETKEEYKNDIKIVRINNPTNILLLKESENDNKLKHLSKVIWNVSVSKIIKNKHQIWLTHLIEILKKYKFDILISSYAPKEAHLAGVNYKINNPQTKWIADMRDEMSKNLHLNINERKSLSQIENKINQYADAITAVSAPILADFKNIMPAVKHFEEIRNGFDHDMMPVENYNEIFTINYAGIFYGSIKPDSFFKGLKIFKEKNKVKINLQFIGTKRNFNVPNEFKNSITFLPKLENIEAVTHIFKADCNLLILPKMGRKGVYSGKIFDYLSARKPIVGVIDTEDVAADLITSLNAGFIADFEDANKIADAIQKAYFWWKERKGLCNNQSEVFKLHRKFQVDKLSKLIEELINENN
jgi:glycosyltransferase involved in cell wall biosynthesis